jgi:hypothetical protein
MGTNSPQPSKVIEECDGGHRHWRVRTATHDNRWEGPLLKNHLQNYLNLGMKLLPCMTAALLLGQKSFEADF